MIRERPLETETVDIAGEDLVIPTAAETLRIKAWLVVRRNQTRDYLDVAALADHLGIDDAAVVLKKIDDYYSEPNGPGRGATQVARQLANPQPADPSTRDQLATYKGLHPRWHEWVEVSRVLRAVATEMTR